MLNMPFVWDVLALIISPVIDHEFSICSCFDGLCPLTAVLYEIYKPDGKPLTLMLPVNSSVQDVMSAVVKPGGDHVLVKMNSTGGKTCFYLI